MGQQAGQNNHNCNHFNRTFNWVRKQVTSLVTCTGGPVTYSLVYFMPKAIFHPFLLDQGDELEELMMYYAQRGFPFSDDKLCQLAFELTYKTKRNGFLPTKKMAGHKWLHGYLQRKPTLHRKNSQNISAAWAIGVNPVQIQKSFELLLEWVHKLKLEFLPNNI